MQQTVKKVRFFKPLTLLTVVLFVLFSSCKHDKRAPWQTPPKGTDSLSFMILGDWGKKGKQFQKPVADQMDIYARKYHIQFIISTGDNFYSRGVLSVTDPHWKASFEDVYNKPGHQVPWYVTLGNHDYAGDPQAQVAYSAMSNRWKMPARYYAVEKKIDNKHNVLFAFTDTSPFVSSYYKSRDKHLQQQDTTAQLAWLRKTLTGSNDTWKITVGHHPVYSAGRHGNTPELINDFAPIFLKSGTDFYICGHDHSLEYLVDPGKPVNYLISGGGSEKTPINGSPFSLFAESSPGFLVMTLYPNFANFYFYNQKGELLYENQVKKQAAVDSRLL